MIRTTILTTVLAVTACGSSGHTRNPSDEHPDDLSGEPRNLPPEGPPGQTIPIRESRSTVNGAPSAAAPGASAPETGTGGSAAGYQ